MNEFSAEICPVVLVEDDRALTLVLTLQLQAAGINCRAVGDGHQALRLIQECRPRVIILDVILPGVSGFEIVEALKRDTAFENLETLQVIVYTSRDLTEADRQRLSVGAGTVFYTKTVQDIDMGLLVKQYL